MNTRIASYWLILSGRECSTPCGVACGVALCCFSGASLGFPHSRQCAWTAQAGGSGFSWRPPHFLQTPQKGQAPVSSPASPSFHRESLCERPRRGPEEPGLSPSVGLVLFPGILYGVLASSDQKRNNCRKNQSLLST